MLFCKEKENIFSAYISKNKATPVDKIPNKNSFNNNWGTRKSGLRTGSTNRTMW